MLSAEQSALLSQEQVGRPGEQHLKPEALEQIAAQQASLAQQQQALREREANVEREISEKISGLDAQVSSGSFAVGLAAFKKWHTQATGWNAWHGSVSVRIFRATSHLRHGSLCRRTS